MDVAIDSFTKESRNQHWPNRCLAFCGFAESVLDIRLFSHINNSVGFCWIDIDFDDEKSLNIDGLISIQVLIAIVLIFAALKSVLDRVGRIQRDFVDITNIYYQLDPVVR